MLTGDSLDVANNVQRKLSPIDVPAQLFPEDKVELLKQLKAAGLTGMVGDGINDVPALAAADVGIAMGVAGTTIAMKLKWKYKTLQKEQIISQIWLDNQKGKLVKDDNLAMPHLGETIQRTQVSSGKEYQEGTMLKNEIVLAC
ncbi:hypothetical protein L7F22_061601 [Adiantum nelumboides]|nr:hypothetical protein [Adiantum nelumboides]